MAIGRALIAEPQLVLADEPTGNLDSRTSTQVVELLLSLQVQLGFALVVATHDLGLASRFDRHVNLHDGRIQAVADGPAQHSDVLTRSV